MVMLSEVLGIVIGLIIFIFLVSLFFRIFGSPECNSLAETTAEELKNAINKVYLEDGVSPWIKEGVPPDSEEGHYISVPIKLCEKEISSGGEIDFFGYYKIPVPIGGIGSALYAKTPTYMIVYETFPEDSFGWSETQPWGGGAGSSLVFYGIMRAAPKLPKVILNTPKYALKIGKKVAGAFVWLAELPSEWSFRIKKISRWFEKVKNNRIIRAIFRRSKAAQDELSVQKDLPLRFMADAYPDEDKVIINSINRARVYKGLTEVEALSEVVLESKPDKYGRYVPVLGEVVGPGGKKYTKLLVKPEYRKFMKHFIDLTEDPNLKKFYEDLFYIPSRFKWLEKIKMEKWYPLKYSIHKLWNTNWFKINVVDNAKNLYNKLKNWKRYFNGKNILDEFDTPQQAGAVKKWSYLNFGDFKKMVKDNFDDYRPILMDITGKSLKNIEDLSDEDILKFLSVYERYFKAIPLEKLGLRGEAIITQSYENLGSEFYKRVNEVVDFDLRSMKMTVDVTKYNNLKNALTKKWDLMTNIEKNKWKKIMTAGHAELNFLTDEQAKKIWQHLQAEIIKEGIFDDNIIKKAGKIKPYTFLVKSDKIKGKMLSGILRKAEYKSLDEFKQYINSFYLMKVITPSTLEKTTLEKIKEISDAFKLKSKGTRFIFLDLGRIGQGPVAPFNFFGPQAARTTTRTLTEVSENGCSGRSICLVEKDSPKPYKLDSRVPEINVKLWRPKPPMSARLPLGISTALFYTGIQEHPRFYVVSPCFATAKVWKDSSDNVYVHIDKTQKCDVGSCPSGVDTPNYCYADEEFLWGEDPFNKMTDKPWEWLYFGEFGGCVAGLSIITGDLWNAMRLCSYAMIGQVNIETIVESQRYRNVPSWYRQEFGWGYWNYLKAGDLCDLFENMKDLGGWRAGKSAASESSKLSRYIKSVQGWRNKHKTFKTVTGISASDICFGITAIGDTSLAWPIKTPMGEIWRKGVPLDYSCMEETAGICTWYKKCYSDADCSPPEWPTGYICDEGTCKKTCNGDEDCPKFMSCVSGICTK